MTHDPLCPYGQAFGHLEPWEPHHYCCQDCNPGMTDPDTVTCQCDLIAKVRADESAKYALIELAKTDDRVTTISLPRGGAHVDWCRDLACYGCEEITADPLVGEPSH